jgi:DeoR/GlpR family transcriptional regulator of sugar metabolism
VLIGTYAEETLQKLTADICFISSSSLSSDGDVTDVNEHENKLRKIIMERVKVKVLLMDNSKKGKLSTHVLCKLADFDYYFNED